MENHSNSNEKLWLLVEMETFDGKATYMIADSDDVIGHQHVKGNLNTGKTVKIRKGNISIPATVVIISDDREFLEAELKELRRMKTEIEDLSSQQSRKRRRTVNDNQPAPTLSTQYYPVIHNTQWKPPQPTLVQTIQPPVPKDRAILASTQTHPEVQYQSRPMTFDQRTQTDTTDDSNQSVLKQLARIIANQGSHLEQQKILAEEQIASQKQLQNLLEEFRIMKNMISEINVKLNRVPANHKEETVYIVNSSNELSSGAGPLDAVQSYDIETSEVVIGKNEEQSVNNDNIIISFENDASNQSRLSLNETSNSVYSSVSELNGSHRKSFNSSSSSVANKFHKNQSISNTSLNLTTNSQANNSIAENIMKEWSTNEEDQNGGSSDGGEMISIGSNNTQVPKHIIRSINWNSHTTATRKLLMALFPRDILATHSLTGKPSPAFMDRKKPIKNQLESKIVADIIQIVTKCCQVPESIVRNAITTKCADENKMNRQRLSKAGLTRTDESDKENHKLKAET